MSEQVKDSDPDTIVELLTVHFYPAAYILINDKLKLFLEFWF